MRPQRVQGTERMLPGEWPWHTWSLRVGLGFRVWGVWGFGGSGVWGFGGLRVWGFGGSGAWGPGGLGAWGFGGFGGGGGLRVRVLNSCGHFSQLWSLFGYRKYLGPLLIVTPKGDILERSGFRGFWVWGACRFTSSGFGVLQTQLRGPLNPKTLNPKP